ncbi:MAG: methylmalonyl Co-A mutase-associated GTPase MeaB [Chitinophagaceae bacterium]
MPFPSIIAHLQALHAGNRHALARAITMVENELPGAEEILFSLKNTNATKLVGVTGPPGSGKSTLVNELIKNWVAQGKKIAVLAVDPSSPFHFGSLLGDRIRMSAFYNHPQVFIRSLASRGALGGLHGRIYEISDLVKEAGFDIIIVETVGVGQSEVDIAGIADCTVVVLVPEAGDMIQTMKAGLLEIADVLVVNKSDHSDAEAMYRNLRIMAHERRLDGHEIPVFKTISSTGEGVEKLAAEILKQLNHAAIFSERKAQMQLEKLWQLIQANRMANLSKSLLAGHLKEARTQKNFNIYTLAAQLSEGENGVQNQ